MGSWRQEPAPESFKNETPGPGQRVPAGRAWAQGNYGARQGNKGPKQPARGLPSTGGLLRHHPGQTQGQDSECGGSGEEVALRAGGGECAPHGQGAGYPLTRPPRHVRGQFFKSSPVRRTLGAAASGVSVVTGCSRK